MTMTENETSNLGNLGNLGIKLLASGELGIVLPGGEELALPGGDVEAVLMRVLLQRQRNSRVGQDRAGTRFYIIHLERHTDGAEAHPKCQWCQEERLADEVLLHPVTKIPLTAKTMRHGAVSDDLAEELGF
jgi:hypothetical protein